MIVWKSLCQGQQISEYNSAEDIHFLSVSDSLKKMQSFGIWSWSMNWLSSWSQYFVDYFQLMMIRLIDTRMSRSNSPPGTSPTHLLDTPLLSNQTQLFKYSTKRKIFFEIFFAFLFRQTPKQDDINATSP